MRRWLAWKTVGMDLFVARRSAEVLEKELEIVSVLGFGTFAVAPLRRHCLWYIVVEVELRNHQSQLP